jgi:hypothetical protein
MPSLLTHQWFSQAIIDRYQSQFPFLKKYAYAVYLGAQGPDPFFFFGRAPFASRKERKDIGAFGSFLHNGDLEQTLLQLLRTYHASNQRDEAITAYMIGALTHYALDRCVHPYVFYRSGFDKDGQLTGIYGRDHGHLEVLIDNAIKTDKQLDESLYQPRRTLAVSEDILLRISSLYHHAYPHVLTPTTFQEGVHDMRSVYQFLYHGGWLKRLLVIAVAGRKSLPYGLIHPDRITRTWKEKVLNVHHQSWVHPVTRQPSNESVYGLIEHAHALMDELIPWITTYPNDPSTVHASIDYDGKLIGSRYAIYESYFS